MFLDIIVDPNWYTTVPTETTAAGTSLIPVTGESFPALLGCIVLILAVTAVMLIVRQQKKAAA